LATPGLVYSQLEVQLRKRGTPICPWVFYSSILKNVNKTVFIYTIKKIKIFLYIFIEKNCTIL